MAKILVVDDEASIVTMLAYNLKKEGYDVVTAEDGEVALEKIWKWKTWFIVTWYYDA